LNCIYAARSLGGFSLHHADGGRVIVVIGDYTKNPVGGEMAMSWSGIWPNRDEPRKWYDRTIRILGGIILGASALFGSARIMGWVK
jgi:hypothetical protein